MALCLHRTERAPAITLVPLEEAEVSARLAGPDDPLVPAVVLHAAHQRALAGVAWYWCAPCLFIALDDGSVLGCASFLDADAPENHSVELGYGILPAFQGRGVATQGVALMLARARLACPQVIVTARTAVSNHASARVLEKNGFRPWGRAHDPDDGDLIVWRTG
ncbi:GNAT family N-acetyltransferase [Pararhodospirillum photometricum]|nr:GNAT family N-acetyltransferase [Pararhodospirillum photometricum]